MGKQGPCCHCGISATPLWRNGPPEKPVLCNACGSRWRTKGTLVNYMPLHSGGCGLKNRRTETKQTSMKKGPLSYKYDDAEKRLYKRKEPSDGFAESIKVYQRSDPSVSVGIEEEASTWSSAGSGMSYTESCVPNIRVPESSAGHWPPWECPVPSKKRSATYQHHRPSGKKFHLSPPDSKPYIYRYASEEDLLVEYTPSVCMVEIGLGGVIIKPPIPGILEQESQASSLIVDSTDCKNSKALNSDESRKDNCSKPAPVRFLYNKHDVLQSCRSPLCLVEMKDIINFETFTGLLTEEEKRELVSDLSWIDTQVQESLKCMFESAQFEGAMCNFQALLSSGMFASCNSDLSPKVAHHYQQLLKVLDLTKSGWIEHCSEICSSGRQRSAVDLVKIMQGKDLKGNVKGLNALRPAGPSAFAVTSKGETFAIAIPTAQVSVKNHQFSLLDAKREKLAESTSKGQKNFTKSFGSDCFSDKSYLTKQGRSPTTTSRSSKLPETPIFDVFDTDILLDLPSNLSFQQAELLHPVVWSKPPATKQVESESKKIRQCGSSSPPSKHDLEKTKSRATTPTTIGSAMTIDSEARLDWEELLWTSPSTGSVNGTAEEIQKGFI